MTSTLTSSPTSEAALKEARLALASTSQTTLRDVEAGNPPKSPTPPADQQARKATLLLLRNGGLLLVVLWAIATWLYGSNYGSQARVHNLTVLVRDFDGGAIGAALVDATAAVRGQAGMPTFVHTNESIEEVVRRVWEGEYWAAVTATAGSTQALNDALATDGGDYSPQAVYTWYGATARYAGTFEGIVVPAVESVLASAEHGVRRYAVAQVASGEARSAQALGIVAQPATSTFIDVAPMNFQARAFLNAFGIVIAHLIQFFFNLVMAGTFTALGIYASRAFTSLLKHKYTVKLSWTLLTALSITGVVSIYNNTARVGAREFFAHWATEWAFAWIIFNCMGIMLVFVPPAFVPMVLFPLIVTSVTATLQPIELSNAVYRISYMFPSHAYWNVAITIYGHGAFNSLHIYLPVLAAWLVVTELGWLFAYWSLSKRLTKH